MKNIYGTSSVHLDPKWVSDPRYLYWMEDWKDHPQPLWLFLNWHTCSASCFFLYSGRKLYLSFYLSSLSVGYTQTRVKVSLVLSTLSCVLTHWYCALLVFLPSLSLNTNLLGVISYTRHTHMPWVIISYHMCYTYSIYFHRRLVQLHLSPSSALLIGCFHPLSFSLSASSDLWPSSAISH